MKYVILFLMLFLLSCAHKQDEESPCADGLIQGTFGVDDDQDGYPQNVVTKCWTGLKQTTYICPADYKNYSHINDYHNDTISGWNSDEYGTCYTFNMLNEYPEDTSSNHHYYTLIETTIADTHFDCGVIGTLAGYPDDSGEYSQIGHTLIELPTSYRKDPDIPIYTCWNSKPLSENLKSFWYDSSWTIQRAHVDHPEYAHLKHITATTIDVLIDPDGHRYLPYGTSAR